ncbi:GNAT family N-acetyltransferase [Aquitalea magnusonii]|uniref:Acetyltransferase (GNAT) family protein n=1 Tax=Aquitalea magnusonii TaxID=332411 RepID=A0A318JD00_9NEIS|nr:GNAT family N-acetyltransferase [Aquitalea magnusonii]PXX46257.1 acetyltransferase (GNAT) family protein [Aquitalea magnusonii]
MSDTLALEFDCDLARLERDMIHHYLSQQSYWAAGLPRDVFERSLAGSLCFGVYVAGKQVGFARMITDQATFAYLADVFVLPDWRGRGISKALLAHIIAYPALQNLRRMLLATADAHGLYAQFGFTALSRPEYMMERLEQQVYQRLAAAVATPGGTQG